MADARIALLRGVNVGGNNKVAMADLRAFAEALGLGEPRTLLQSGNLVFRSEAEPAELEALLEREAKARLGLNSYFLVRTGEEWADVVRRNPFPQEAEAEPSQFLMMALKAASDAATIEALQAAITGPERVKAVGRHAYLVFPEGIGRSKLSMAMVDRRLGQGTGRNWNTVLKLLAMTQD